MPIMDSTNYLPQEKLNYRNYPEVRDKQADINTLFAYALRVNEALISYNSGEFDKIDLNTNELETNITLCRSISETLGTAKNVCYDLLLELRVIQKNMQLVRYLGKENGTRYVGKPTVQEESGA
ncbi:hypothetical protein D3C81_1505220 [compost metagenome]